jgi:hypothetical protein
MKRFIVIAAVGLVAVAIYAVTASGTPQAVTPKQFAALSKKVAKLQKDFNTLQSLVVTCAFNEAVPVAEFGNPPDEGYAYQNPDKSVELEPALDVSATSSAQGFFLNTTPACATAINAGKKAVGLRAQVALRARK